MKSFELPSFETPCQAYSSLTIIDSKKIRYEYQLLVSSINSRN